MSPQGFKLVSSVTVMEQPIEDMDVFGTKLAVVGKGGMFFYDIQPYATQVFVPTYGQLEGVVSGRIQSDGGKIRSIRLADQGATVIVGMLNRVL